MEVETYTIFNGQTILAEGMALEHALLFIGAFMRHYYNEPNLSLSLQREFRPMTDEEKRNWE